MVITTTTSAGSLNSSDVLVTIAPPTRTNQITFTITSPVLAQFGTQIKATAIKTLANLNVTACDLMIQDQGALDLVIEARIMTAFQRSRQSETQQGKRTNEN